MTKSRISLIIVSTLLILAFTYSSVLAEGVPQGWVDDDGDELLGELPAWSGPFVPELDDYPLAEQVVIVNGGPAIPAPVGEIYTKKPDYYFNQVPSATKYRVKVYNFYTTDLVYVIKGPGVCDNIARYCYLTPTLNLKYVDVVAPKGYYYWKLEAKVGINWYESIPRLDFRVYSPGFTSLFSTVDVKWKPVFGTWSVTSTGYLKTKPVTGEYTSVVHKHKFTDDYSFEVKMKRKDDSNAENFIIVKGYPNLEDSNEDGWYQGISFGYNNAGNCRLDRWNNLSRQTINDWEYGCNVKPYDWNVLSVFVHDGVLYAYMNGLEIFKIADAVDYGWVGIGAYEDDSDKNALLVDYARVWYP